MDAAVESVAPESPHGQCFDKHAEDSDEYCDGPGARTRSKMGQEQCLTNRLTSPSFLVQIPFYSLKKEKNRKCSVCGKHGRTPSDLLRHMRVHTGERPFPCVGCDKKFKCKRSQLTHQYLTHSITDGLSSHRLQILELKKMRRPTKPAFPLHFPEPIVDITHQKMSEDLSESVVRQPFSDQDEDTEIVAGEDVPLPNGEVKTTTFEGFFKAMDSQDLEKVLPPGSNEMVDTDMQNSNPPEITDDILENHSEISCDRDNKDVKDSLNAEEPLRVPILRIKTHKCTHCKRQFRSIYTLRYHLRSMHDEKVYLSPALESRLKKRRWLPPHVRLQKPRINLSLGLLLKNRMSIKEKVNVDSNVQKPETSIEEPKQNIPSPTTFPEEVNKSVTEHKQDVQTSTNSNTDLASQTSQVATTTAVIKTEKIDPNPNETSVPENLSSTDLNNNSSSTLRNILTSKESLFNQLHQYTSTFSSQIPGTDSSPSLGKSVSNSYIVPPHIFLPSNSQLDEGLENNKPVSWESLHVTSENVLVTKMEAIHPTTQQKFVLYKCSQCGKAFSGLRAISVHLASHNDNAGNDCEKCGASFKWQNELETHMDCHRADRKFIPSSQFLPSYYVNPFPIPVLPTGEQAVMPTTGLLSYPFFPMPQQISPLMQPGFFPFFTTAVQPSSQVQHVENGQSGPTTSNATCSPTTELSKDNNNEDKNVQQNCSFQCKMCPKTFDRIFSLQRHERIHSGVKACFCKTCGRGFSELRNLRHHIVRFHADTAKMEPLPYRRQPTRVRSSSQRLVSFLKKTAVRILNSIGQSKMDPPAGSEKIPTEDSDHNIMLQQQQQNDYSCKQGQLQDGDNSPQNLTLNHQARTQDSNLDHRVISTEKFHSNLDIDKNPSLEEPKNMMNYMKVPELEDLPKLNGTSVLNNTAKSLLQNKNSNNGSSTSNRPLEVLQDPKRSLLGNRRKGRPFKLTTNNSCNFLSPIADENLFAITQKILNGMPKLNIESTPAFLTNPTAMGTSVVSQELAMPQLSFFNADITNNEPLDMTSVKEPIKLPPEIKTEVEKKTTDLLTTSDISNNYSSNVLPVSDPSLTNGQMLQNQTLDSKCMFPCSYCHRSFNSLSDLNRHMTFHADIRPFKCPYCSYCSRTNSQLKVHMMRHEGIKHYMCQICNYNGVTQSDLNRHLKTRTHLLRSRNICACCGTGFHTRSLSEEHYKSCRLMGGTQDSAKSAKDTRLHHENKNRGNRLKHVQKPIEDSLTNAALATPKKEFFKNLLELGKMGVPFADFLQQSNIGNVVK